MRYRLHINRAEFLAALIPCVDGAVRLFAPHRNGHAGIQHGWEVFHPYVMPCLLLATPLLLVLQYLYGYVELTPSSLEYHPLWRHRSVPYSQIERIVPALQLNGSYVRNGVTEIYVYGMKKLSLNLDKQGDFLTELKQYAPQARMESLFTP